MSDNTRRADRPAALPDAAHAALERMNEQAGGLHIWLRTQANAPAQRPWFRETGLQAAGAVATGRVAAGQLKAVPHCWHWRDIAPYLQRIAQVAAEAEVPPIEFADRQQFLLLNPGLGGRLQAASTIRCAVSIYNPGDVAPVHLHSPNASRTILSEHGGYTTVEGERCPAARGDVILTPNGTWHDHGNDGDGAVIWMDILDWPLLEFLDCVWLDEAYPGPTPAHVRAQTPTLPTGYSQQLYGQGGLLPSFVPHQRGIGHSVSPMLHYRGADIRNTLDSLRDRAGDPYEGIRLRLVNPATGQSVFPTQEYSAQLLRPGAATAYKRETSSTLYVVIDGEGYSEVAGRRFGWNRNDIFVVPSFLWRRHVNTGSDDAVLYAVSDAPLLEKIGQYRAQGRPSADADVLELA